MVIIIYIFLYLAILFISHRKFKRWINILSVFAFLWCFFGSISSMGLYNMRTPSIIVHQYAWLFVISVSIPFLLGVKKVKFQQNEIREFVPATGESSIALVQLFALVMLIPLFFKMITSFISSGSLTAIRQFFFSGDVFSSIYVDMIFRQLPFGMLEGLIVCYIYSFTKNKSPKHLLYAVIDTLLATFVSGGRYPVMLLIYSIIIILITSGVKYSFNKRFAKRLKMLIVVAVVFMLGITVNRGQAIIKNIVVYFSGSFSFMDYIVCQPEMFALDDRTYGYLLFGAIFEPIVLLLKVLGLTDLKVPQWYFNIYCQQFYNIGTENTPIYFNNNTSIIYYLLRDFSVFGILIGGALFGIVLSKLHNQMTKGKELSTLMYIYMSNVLFNTVMTHQFFGMVPLFVFLAFFLCSRKMRIIFKVR